MKTFRQSAVYLLVSAALGLTAVSFALPALASGQHAGVHHKGYKTLPSKTNGSGVVVSYKLSGKPALGKPLTITLLLEGVKTQDAAVNFTADSALSLDAKHLSKQALKPSNNNSMQVVVTPNAQGLHYLNIFTVQEGRSSAAAIAVQIGKATLKPNGQPAVNPQGERIITMPSK